MRNTFRLTSRTYTDLDQPHIYQRFMQGYHELLRSNLKQYKVMDQKGDLREIQYSCGQDHDPRNPNWKPFHYLEFFCRKCGYDDMEARDVIEEQIGRRLDCEGQLLSG